MLFLEWLKLAGFFKIREEIIIRKSVLNLRYQLTEPFHSLDALATGSVARYNRAV